MALSLKFPAVIALSAGQSNHTPPARVKIEPAAQRPASGGGALRNFG
jgi:hypothetical protein